MILPVAPASTRVAAAPDCDCVRRPPLGPNLPKATVSRPEAKVAVPEIVSVLATLLALMTCDEDRPAFCVAAQVATTVLSSFEASARVLLVTESLTKKPVPRPLTLASARIS